MSFTFRKLQEMHTNLHNHTYRSAATTAVVLLHNIVAETNLSLITWMLPMSRKENSVFV